MAYAWVDLIPLQKINLILGTPYSIAHRKFPICPFIVGESSNGKSIKPHERLLAYLYHLGCYASDIHDEYSHGMSAGAINESISMSNQIINEYLVPREITFPTEEESDREARIFARNDYPCIMDMAIDGCQIKSRFHVSSEIKIKKST